MVQSILGCFWVNFADPFSAFSRNVNYGFATLLPCFPNHGLLRPNSAIGIVCSGIGHAKQYLAPAPNYSDRTKREKKQPTQLPNQSTVTNPHKSPNQSPTDRKIYTSSKASKTKISI